ncbi:MAG TPA: hypothetical protein ENJ53_09660 [Phaeodactylibacter sp.]|nr:hypothetical protein [Phaeodactylibacter sp.]
MNTKLNILRGTTFFIIFSFLFASCVKENVLIPAPELTYKIEDVTIEGVALKKITGSINQSLTLKSSYQYLLSGLVFVEDSLTIEKGATFYATTDEVTALIIKRRAKIFASGTADEPIIFTSQNTLTGTSQPGDWGGIHINGAASLNSRRSGLVELIGKYGRTDMTANDLDDSGKINYLRIEYAGKDMNGESGAFNLNGVGSSTTVTHIQVYQALSNGIRCRGGAANLKYAIATQPSGKGFRWDDGWRGFGQYWVVHFTETTTDTLTAIEGRSGTVSDLPISAPVISNITIIGLGENAGSPQVRGIRFRNATHGKIYNSIIAHCQRGVRADYALTNINSGNLIFANNNVFNNNPNYYSSSSSVADIFETSSFNNSSNVITMDGYKGTATDNVFAISGISSWFDNVNFKGAVEMGNDWTNGWAAF